MGAVDSATAVVWGSTAGMFAGGEEGMVGITGDSKSYADISMTGDVGGEQ